MRTPLALLLVAAAVLSEDTLREAQDLAGRGKFAAALPLFEKALETEPESSDALLGSARCLRELGRPSEALLRVQKAVAVRTEKEEGDARLLPAVAELGECLKALGRFDDALPALEQALAIRRRLHPGDSLDTALALRSLSVTYANAGRYKKGLPSALEALAMARRLVGDRDHIAVAGSLGHLATVLSQVQRIEEAVEAYGEAIAMLERVGAPPTFVSAYNVNLCSALHDLRRWVESVEAGRRGLAWAQRMGDHPNVAVFLTAYGTSLRRAGRAAEAARVHERALAIRTKVLGPKHADVALSLNNLAVAVSDTGDFERADELAKRALAMAQPDLVPLLLTNRVEILVRARRLDEAETASEEALRLLGNDSTPVAASCLRNLGRILEARGQLEAAAARFERAVALFDRAGLDDSAMVVRLSLGKVLHRLGRDVDALELNRRALEAVRRLPLLVDIHGFDALNNTAVSLITMGRATEAVPFLEEALAHARRVRGDAHPDVGLALFNLRQCHVEARQYDEAVAFAKEAVAVYERLGKGHEGQLALALGGLGHAHLYKGEHDAAGAAYDRALPLFEAQEEPRLDHWAITLAGAAALDRRRGTIDRARARLEKAADLAAQAGPGGFEHVVLARLGTLLARDLGAPEKALPLLRRAVGAAEADRESLASLAVTDRAARARFRDTAEPFHAMGLVQIGLGDPAGAFTTLERGRARDLLDLLERGRFDPLAQAERRARARDDDAALAEVAAVRRRIAERDALIGRLRHELDRAPTRERGGALRDARIARIEDLRARGRIVADIVPIARPAAAEVVQRLLGRDEAILAYSLGGDESFALLVRRDAVRGVRLPVDEASVARMVDTLLADVDGAGGADLFGALVPPELWTELRGVRTVYVVPHGALARVPFEMLRPTAETRWIDEGPALAYLPAGSVLSWCRRRRDAQKKRTTLFDLVALGDPVFQGLAPLPGTRREVEAIRASVGKAAVLLGEDATEATLFSLAPKGRILHVATHQVGAPGRPRLALTAPETPVPGDDGYLVVDDLFEHWRDRLSGCELVVLSACESRSGDELQALPFGFLYAGCPAVIASLWRVDDTSTADLFADFYRRLAAGASKLEALTGARRALKKKRPRPYHWAPFVYIGDPR